MLTLSLLVLSVILCISLLVVYIAKNKKHNTPKQDTVETIADAGNQNENKNQEVPKQTEEEVRSLLLAETNHIAAGYDYDNAIEKIKAYPEYEKYAELTDAIAGYEATKATCVPVNIEEVTHVFYHSLVIDPDRAFANQDKDHQAAGNNQWMTTVDEFNKITQSMYEKGYVLVDLHDIAGETTDENGTKHFTPGTIMLPPGKKAFVLSLDDLSYYHAYDGYGYASKLILDEGGKPTCEYIQADGTTLVGDYDVVPLMDKFVQEHPDASYRGAKGTIALTGYNGILGYRTDISYQTVPADLDTVKVKWLENHPEFSLDAERASAKAVADAMKAEGWNFASHTWGHLKVGTVSLERIQADTQKWKENVEPLVGSTDTIIFAHGEDLGGWGDYAADNVKFNYLKSQGFNYFCNVDSGQYCVQIRDNYVRQGRRNLDGYRIYNNAIGKENSVSDLFDAAQILDPKRPPVKPLS
ncbi:MAG: polysaccharide deacetylase [Lachnospiraceae bacterium]